MVVVKVRRRTDLPSSAVISLPRLTEDLWWSSLPSVFSSMSATGFTSYLQNKFLRKLLLVTYFWLHNIISAEKNLYS